MKIKITSLILISFFTGYSQSTSFGDKIKGNVKEYTETWYNAEKNDNDYIKLEKKNYDTYRKNENDVFVKVNFFSVEKHEIPQNSYNNKNQITETINYYEDGEIMNRTKYIYKNDKLFEDSSYNDSDTIISKTKYYYKNDLKVKEIKIGYSYFAGYSVDTTKISFEYDKNKNLIKRTYKSQYQEDVDTYKYNNENYLTETHSLAINGEFVYKRKYIQFDNNNWTQMVVDEAKQPDGKSRCYFIEREIIYE
ncbi:hypothetical protein [Olleya sp. HaHaR_3_96]|uniref:hypothetical protein n=1 Tax=Olleya sp. HaHaR_3_96 TaxID=2745560 RepID=UPI001C4F2A29|nr:hypothetical protein [Olleya sp. HaHaR_3_96]QXP59702.1 hypothetical protein H0I26_17610 [Olleya sp. HaHaR_3_96]